MKNWHVLCTLAICCFIRIVDPFLLESSRLSWFDGLQRNQTPVKSEQIIIIDIDEPTLDKLGQYPIPRNILAEYIDEAPEALIGLNILLSEEDRFGGDAALASALSWKNSVLAITPSSKTNTKYRPPQIGVAVFGEKDATDFLPELNGMLFAREELHDASLGYGTISSSRDVDGILRRAPLLEYFDNRIFPAFALDILRVAAGDISYQISTDDYGIQFVRIPAFKNIPTDINGNVQIAFWNQFERYSFTDIDKIPEGSIAIVGATFEGSPVVTTPVGNMYPHDIQANLIKTMIDGVVITRPDEFFIYELLFTVIVSLLLLFALVKLSIWISGVGFVAISVLSVIGATSLFTKSYLLIDPVFPLLTLLLVFSHGSFVQFYTQFKLKQMIKAQFGTYLDPRQVEQLQKNPDLLKLGGERREMSYMFTDIIGFTPISEHYKNNDDPEGLCELINEYLDEVTQIVLNNGGMIDKFMGDCIMAVFSAPIVMDNHAEMAVKSAIEIEQKTLELKKLYKERGLPDINVGTGVNTGTAILGNMGSSTRFDYSVIGDAVNLAARLEATAGRGDYKKFPTIISSYTQELLPKDMKSIKIGDIKVKGKEELIEIFSPYTFQK
ncbi:adenylate/guanylate cyclase domain-containing protein [bacterium]|nr:adenylate/guanylate cyclase domain-containing protein [bacterium]